MRRLVLLSSWLLVLGLVGLQVLWFAGASPLPLDWLWAFTPKLYLPAWVVLIGAMVMGSRTLVVGASVVAVAHLAILGPAMTGSITAGVADLRIASANLLSSNPELEAYATELGSLAADVVVLQEVKRRGFAVVERILGDHYPHRALMLRQGAAVLSKMPLRDERIVDTGGVPMLTVTVRVGERSVRLWNVHTPAPHRRAGLRTRDDMLAGMIELRRTETLPLLAVGDYNATAWHSSFSEFVSESGLYDAHDLVGRGLAGTWKSARLVEPLIDHVVLSSDWTVLDVREGRGPGSDHRPVVADLRFSSRSGPG